MTKKDKLSWRLSQLPTASEVADLVSEEIITKEQARDILFKDADEVKSQEKEQIVALKEQIKFLERIVDALSKNRSTTITYTPKYPNWTYVATNSIPATMLTTSAGATTYSVNTAQMLGTPKTLN